MVIGLGAQICSAAVGYFRMQFATNCASQMGVGVGVGVGVVVVVGTVTTGSDWPSLRCWSSRL